MRQRVGFVEISTCDYKLETQDTYQKFALNNLCTGRSDDLIHSESIRPILYKNYDFAKRTVFRFTDPLLT
jgi:hypothetical protein